MFIARQVTKVYHMGEVEVHALRGIDLELAGVGVHGAVGALRQRQSTLLNILGGLDVPTAGQVFYRDGELTAADDRASDPVPARSCRFRVPVLQPDSEPDGARECGAGDRDRADPLTPEKALELVNLGDRLDHFPSQLSGGEQQRVAIARAIAKRPDVLLCDEPTGALDNRHRVVVLEAIDRVNRELGTTTAVITHNAAISEMADRVISLADGRIASEQRNVEKVGPRDTGAGFRGSASCAPSTASCCVTCGTSRARGWRSAW